MICVRQEQLWVRHGRKAKSSRRSHIAGMNKEIRVAVLADEHLECYLGADFIRTFGMIHDSVKNKLTVTHRDRL